MCPTSRQQLVWKVIWGTVPGDAPLWGLCLDLMDILGQPNKIFTPWRSVIHVPPVLCFPGFVKIGLWWSDGHSTGNGISSARDCLGFSYCHCLPEILCEADILSHNLRLLNYKSHLIVTVEIYFNQFNHLNYQNFLKSLVTKGSWSNRSNHAADYYMI